MAWLFFLLPIAALSGWMVAKGHYRKQFHQTFMPSNSNYFKGLNYLLNEQPDKAIDVFIHLLEVNSESVETYQTLAHLFRRQGEIERAIRIHQNLLARPTLTTQQRDNILFELAMDYMSAGVLDRAEQLLLELSQHISASTRVFEQLSLIYQQEKKWLQAIEVTKKTYTHNKQSAGPLLAQFYCELAQQSTTQNKIVLEYIKHALFYDPACVRAHLIEASTHIENKHFHKAIKSLHKIEQQDCSMLSEALPLLHTCYQQLNKLHDFEQWLKSLLERHPELTRARIMLASVIEQRYGGQEAQEFLYLQLQSHPSIEGLQKIITLGGESNPLLIPLVKNIIDKLITLDPRYTCQHCGFSGKNMYWHCPGCKQWGTIKPTEIHLSDLQTFLELTS